MANRKLKPHALEQLLPDYAACKDLAKRVGCAPTHVLNIRNRRKRPSLDLAVKLCRETGLSIQAFTAE
jgi:transcriptional regulator with XRE-family HTH domain